MKHWSDCAVYNEPAFPAGECDCGGYTEEESSQTLIERKQEDETKQELLPS